jgi:hypothetical protein
MKATDMDLYSDAFETITPVYEYEPNTWGPAEANGSSEMIKAGPSPALKRQANDNTP